MDGHARRAGRDAGPGGTVVSAAVWAARLVPVAIAAQFLLAGLGLFDDAAAWAWHGALGFGLIVPIGIVLVASLINETAQPWRGRAGILSCLYILQPVLIIAGQETGSGLLQALHPFNGALLLAASLWLAATAQPARTSPRKRSTSPRSFSAKVDSSPDAAAT